MNIEIRHYKSEDGKIDLDVPFINGTAYINATSVYQKFGKPQSSFATWKADVLLPYANRLLELGKFPSSGFPIMAENQQVTLDDVIITKKGGNKSNIKGTWFHPRLGIAFARWLDQDFEIWCDEQIAELLMAGEVKLKPEDQEWIDHATDIYEDCPDGGRKSMNKIKKLILEHHEKGYPMSNFQNMLNDLSKYADKESKEKLFEKIRKLVKDLYEEGILGRTAHEEMLELATIKVIKVLKAEIRKERKLRERFTLNGAAPVIELPVEAPAEVPVVVPVEPVIQGPLTLPQTASEAKAEHDNALKEFKPVIDASFLNLHKAFDLCPITPVAPILPCLYGRTRPVAEAAVMIKEAGYKLAFIDKLIKPPYWETQDAPSLSTRDRWTKIGVSLWYKPGYISINVSKELGNNKYDKLLNVRLTPIINEDPTLDPAFYYGRNPEGTVCVCFSSISNTVMIYGVPATKK
jgi:hypothetical protein